MKCPHCGKQMVTTPKYPGYYLCYDCRVKMRIPQQDGPDPNDRNAGAKNTGQPARRRPAGQNSGMRTQERGGEIQFQTQNSGRARQENVSYSERVVRQSVRSIRKKKRQNIQRGVILAVIALAICALAVFLLWKFVFSSDSDETKNTNAFTQESTASSLTGAAGAGASAFLEDDRKEKRLLTVERTEAAAEMTSSVSGYQYMDLFTASNLLNRLI